MNMCRKWLAAARSTATPATVRAMSKAAVLGDKSFGYTVELQDGTQLYVGRAHCAYCARAEALMLVATGHYTAAKS